MLGDRSLKIRQFPAMESIETILAFVSSPDPRMSSGVLEILIPRGVQHLEEADLGPRRTSVDVLTVESADRALLPV